MTKDDTIQLLKETNAGVKTAVSSINEIYDKVQSQELKDILLKYRQDHENIGDKTHEMLNKYQEEDKEPNPMAKAMSWLKINVKMTTNSSDHEVASLMMDGCNMGIKSLCKYQNKYQAAEEDAQKMAQDLVDLEQDFMIHLRPYL